VLGNEIFIFESNSYDIISYLPVYYYACFGVSVEKFPTRKGSFNSFPFAHLLSKKPLSIMIRKCLKTRWCWPSICVNIFQSSLPNDKLFVLLVDIPLKFVQWISWCISRSTFVWNVEYSETLWERCWVKYRISIKHLQMHLKTIYNHNHNNKVKFKRNWKPGHQYYM